MLTEEQKEQEIQQAFKAFDKDGSGSITRNELADVYQHLTSHAPTEHDVDQLMALMDVDQDNEISMEEFVSAMKKYLKQNEDLHDGKRKRKTFEESRAGVHQKIAKYMLQFEVNSNIDEVYKNFVNNFSRMIDLDEHEDVVMKDKIASDEDKERLLGQFRQSDLSFIAHSVASSSTLDEEYEALKKCREVMKILTLFSSSEDRKRIAPDIANLFNILMNTNIVPSLLKSLTRTSDMFVYESLRIIRLLIPGPRLDDYFQRGHILSYDRKFFKMLIAYNGIPVIAKLIGSNRLKISDEAVVAIGTLCVHHTDIRDYALEMGVLKPLLESFQGIFERSDYEAALRFRVWCLSVMFGHTHSSPPDLKWVKQAVPLLSELLSFYGKRYKSIQILSSICRCISLAPGFYVKDVVERLMEFLCSPDVRLVEVALKTIKRQFSSGDQLLVNLFLKLGENSQEGNLFVNLVSKLICHEEHIIRSRALELMSTFVGFYGQVEITYQSNIVPMLCKIIKEDKYNRTLAVKIIKYYCRGSMDKVRVLVENPATAIIDVLCDCLRYFKETDDEVFQKMYNTPVKYNFELCHHALVALNNVISCGDLADEMTNPFACKFSVRAINQLASLLKVIKACPKNEVNAWRYKQSPASLEERVTGVLMKIKIVADRFPNDQDAVQFSNLITSILKSQYEQDVFQDQSMQTLINHLYEQYVLDHNKMMDRINTVTYSLNNETAKPGTSTLHNWNIDLTRKTNLLSSAHSELSQSEPKISWDDFMKLGNWWLENLSNKKMNIQQFREVVSKMFKITDPVVQKDLFLRMDVDGDRGIDFREFSVGILHLFRQASEEDRMMMMFTLYDDDGNGYISVDEVYAIQEYVLRAKGEEVNEEHLRREVLQRFKAADENNDGRIDFNEFKHAQQSKLIASLF